MPAVDQKIMRKSPAIARKIRTRFGEAAYLAYKNDGIVPDGLDSAPSTTIDRPMDASVITTLREGDVVRDSTGKRLRVQKVRPDGLRLNDTVNGVRDLDWGQIVSLHLVRVDHDETGPAARRLSELRQEAERMGLTVPTGSTTKEIEALMGAATAKGDEVTQIDVMLAKDAKDLQDFNSDAPWLSPALVSRFWSNDQIIAEEKLDGVRLKLHLVPGGARLDSRRRDTKTRRFSEKTANLPHLRAIDVEQLYGTVLDGEGMIPVRSGVSPVSGERFHGSLSISTACVNAGPDAARLIQDALGRMHYHAFDILYFKGQDVTRRPWHERRQLLEAVIDALHKLNPDAKEFVYVTRYAAGPGTSEKIDLFQSLVSSGGEGVMFKNKNHTYQPGKRSDNWTKLKRFQDVDAYICGYVPGKSGNEGLVGALELAVLVDGMEVGVAAVSQITQQERIACTASDGSLKPEYYGRVVTFRGQEITKNGRYRHAILVSFREDKTKEDCDGYEIIDELRQLHPLLRADSSSQDSFLS